MKYQILLVAAVAMLFSACGQAPTPAEPAAEAKAAPARGPHRGKLFQSGDFRLEVTIFEDGVPPEFRVYPTLKGQPLDLSQVSLTLTLKRLGATQVVRFSPKADYLVGDQEVYEPHSFSVDIKAAYRDQSYAFAYDQIEWRVQLSEAQLKASAIEVLTSVPGLVGDTLDLPGEIRVAPNSETVMLAPVSGVVITAPAMLGQSVRRGDVLAVLESRELADLKRSYLEAKERARLAESTFQREAQLWREQITPEQDYLAARSAKAEADINVASSRAALMAFGVSVEDLRGLSLAQPGNLARLTLRAPRNGRVTLRELAPGQRVTPESHLFTVADLSQLVAVVSATSGQLDGLQPGQPVSITQTGKQGQGVLTGSGKVLVVSPQLDEASRAAPVYITLDGKESGWRPGQFVSARITRAQAPAAVTVSPGALQSFRDWTVVFARFGDQFEIRPVTIGRQDAERVEILSGLNAGQAYVGKNSFLLKADLGKSEAEHDH
ncbi:MAG: efflux RND transporter periplasmic adaptor subunit [Pseudomonadota bacterium]